MNKKPATSSKKQPVEKKLEQYKILATINVTLISLIIVLVIVIVSIMITLNNVVNDIIKSSKNLRPMQNTNNGSLCIQDAKMCPDGTYVQRFAPSCDFAPCP